MVPLTVEPTHELDDTWDAPFFFVDNRHVFLVSTHSPYVPLWSLADFGVNFGSVLSARSRVPPLVFETPPVVPPKPWEQVALDPGIGVNPAALRRHITEDAYIRKAVGVTGNVAFRGTMIGPSARFSARHRAVEESQMSVSPVAASIASYHDAQLAFPLQQRPLYWLRDSARPSRTTSTLSSVRSWPS